MTSFFHLVHSGWVSLVTAIECIFTDCIFSLMIVHFCKFLQPLTHNPSPPIVLTQHKPLYYRCYMGYFSCNTEMFFPQKFISLESLCSDSLRSCLMSLLWESILMLDIILQAIAIIKPQPPAMALHVNSLDETY